MRSTQRRIALLVLPLLLLGALWYGGFLEGEPAMTQLRFSPLPRCPEDGLGPNALSRGVAVIATASAFGRQTWVSQSPYLGESPAFSMDLPARRQSVSLKFGLCPWRNPPGERMLYCGDADQIEWYAEREIDTDPARAESFTAEMPAPPAPLACWRGEAKSR
jgi:hypothetical protein